MYIATFLYLFRKQLPLSSTLTDSTWPPWMSDFRESLNPSMGIKNALCLLTFPGSWLLYLAYMGHSVSFIPCQMCVRIDVLNFWEKSKLVCVLWRNCLLFCLMRCRELRVFLRSAEFLFKTQSWIPSWLQGSWCYPTDRNGQANFLVQKREDPKRRDGMIVDRCGRVGGSPPARNTLPQGILSPAEPKPGSPCISLFPPFSPASSWLSGHRWEWGLKAWMEEMRLRDFRQAPQEDGGGALVLFFFFFGFFLYIFFLIIYF